MTTRRYNAPKAVAPAKGAVSSRSETVATPAEYHNVDKGDSAVDDELEDFDWPPLLVIPKGRNVVIVRKRRFHGVTSLDIRLYQRSSDGRPTRNGISIPIEYANALGEALASFERESI